MSRVVATGRLEVAGFLFDRRRLPESRLQSVVLALFSDGCTYSEHTDWGWLSFPTPRWMRHDECHGLPLQAVSGRWSTIPTAEVAPSVAGAGQIIVVDHGEMRILDSKDFISVDPARWIQLNPSSLSVVAGRPLGPPPAPLVDPAPKATVNAQILLGEHAGPHPELAAIARALQTGTTLPPVGHATGKPTWLGRLARWIFGHAPPLPTSRQLVEPQGENGLSMGSPPQTSPSNRIRRWLWRSPLGWFAAQRHRRFFDSMAEKFRSGDLSEALRWAIPLNDAGGWGDSVPPLSAAGPRGSLGFSNRRARGGGIGVGINAYQRLQQMYRDALTRLKREKRYREAAFLQAEILGENEEAVLWLVDEAEYALAAELASGRDLDVALQVSLFLLAGETHRAMILARRYGVFRQAVERLAKIDMERSKVLRAQWAHSLAEQGAWVAAIDAARPLKELDALRTRWEDIAIRSEGPDGAWLLGRRLAAGHKADLMPLAKQLLERRDPESRIQRSRFREAVESQSNNRTSQQRALVLAARRATLRTSFAPSGGRKALGAFDADLRRAQDGVRPQPAPIARTIGLHERGPSPIEDAVRLNDGSYLIALGEAGVVVLLPSGERHHIDIPTHRLCPSNNGARCLLVTARGTHFGINRYDAESRHIRPCGHYPATVLPNAFAGSRLYVGDRLGLRALDISGPSPQLLTERRDLSPQDIRLLDDGRLQVLHTDADGPQVWLFDRAYLKGQLSPTDQDGLILRHRGPSSDEVLAIHGSRRLQTKEGRTWLDQRCLSQSRATAAHLGERCAVLRVDQDDQCVLLGYLDGNRVAEVHGPTLSTLRLQGPVVLAGIAGRLVALDLEWSAILVDQAI